MDELINFLFLSDLSIPQGIPPLAPRITEELSQVTAICMPSVLLYLLTHKDGFLCGFYAGPNAVDLRSSILRACVGGALRDLLLYMKIPLSYQQKVEEKRTQL